MNKAYSFLCRSCFQDLELDFEREFSKFKRRQEMMANVKRKSCKKPSQPKPKPKQLRCGFWVKNILGGEDFSLLSFLSKNTPHIVREADLSGKHAIVHSVV